MEYQLTAELASPLATPDLDPLQRVGVVALLDERLSALAGIEGPDGVEIVPVEHSVEAHAGGAVVSWLLDAPALVFAEDATRAVLEQLVEEIDLLHGWEVKHCAVTATDDQLETALAASAAPDGAHATAGDGTGWAADVDIAVSEAELAERRQRLLRSGPQLRAFDPDVFGELDDEQARYAAGALLHGVELLVDEVFGDVQLLDDEDATVDEVDALWALDELPPEYADRYTALFAKQFLVTTTILGHRLTRDGWDGPLCVAEALALRIAAARAEVELDLADVLDPDDVEVVFARFAEVALAGLDDEPLFDVAEADLPDDLAFDRWFQPRARPDGTPPPHPYLADQD
ncbi:hypothetical protein B1813_13100 [Saccharomonospora piscinae]|uniref:Uncharacterized protein n=1 Tax=Saccharomonospora piscinae TaxID=687388 RepID=A0A1V9A7D8_SACPI|nr:hypothetical protein [Saccharomonospora piscinae]OQO93032.1 hypothetical protein B1813_13100 [Saccharomonospora piscinae]